jgi:site-specific recombinase XerD
MNAIKSYFTLVHSRSEIFDAVIRPKPTKTLPKVLSSSEVKRLFQATQNLKHLLEAGTDMIFIQKLLGHSQIKTTEIYAKVSNRIISQVKSPLDSIN